MILSPTQKYAMELAYRHNGLKRFNGSIYWIGADIDESTIKTSKYPDYPDNIETVGNHSVKALVRMNLLSIKKKIAKIVECEWCDNKEYNRFECSLINSEGHSLVNDNMVVTCIADFCPKCGRRIIITQR